MQTHITGADSLKLVINTLELHKQQLKDGCLPAQLWNKETVLSSLDVAIAALRYLLVTDINLIKEEIPIEEL